VKDDSKQLLPVRHMLTITQVLTLESMDSRELSRTCSLWEGVACLCNDKHYKSCNTSPQSRPEYHHHQHYVIASLAIQSPSVPFYSSPSNHPYHSISPPKFLSSRRPEPYSNASSATFRVHKVCKHALEHVHKLLRLAGPAAPK
jgi:hypothetical protein